MRKKFSVGNTVGFILTFLVALTILIPIFWLIVSAFKTDAGVISYPPRFFPDEWTINQFKYVTDSIPIFRMLGNTVIFSGCVTVISVLFDSMAGYAFARMNFKGKKMIFSIILLTMMVPFQVIMTVNALLGCHDLALSC